MRNRSVMTGVHTRRVLVKNDARGQEPGEIGNIFWNIVQYFATAGNTTPGTRMTKKGR